MSNNDSKKVCMSSIVLGIVGIVFSLFVPAVSYSCSITGLVLGVKRKETHRSTAGIVLNIVAISIAAINSIVGIIMTVKMFGNDKKQKEKALKEQEDKAE